jgi:hypothetical protein
MFGRSKRYNPARPESRAALAAVGVAFLAALVFCGFLALIIK